MVRLEGLYWLLSASFRLDYKWIDIRKSHFDLVMMLMNYSKSDIVCLV